MEAIKTQADMDNYKVESLTVPIALRKNIALLAVRIKETNLRLRWKVILLMLRILPMEEERQALHKEGKMHLVLKQQVEEVVRRDNH
jgi:hypothetical protein